MLEHARVGHGLERHVLGPHAPEDLAALLVVVDALEQPVARAQDGRRGDGREPRSLLAASDNARGCARAPEHGDVVLHMQKDPARGYAARINSARLVPFVGSSLM